MHRQPARILRMTSPASPPTTMPTIAPVERAEPWLAAFAECNSAVADGVSVD